MLAKIHLKTACGCERSYFETRDFMPYEVRVPIKASHIVCRVGRITPAAMYAIRTFHIVKARFISSRRAEYWYEETLYG